MSTLLPSVAGNRGVELLLVVSLVAAFSSCTAWFLSRRLAGKAALRHLILFSALVCCLASPALAWLCGAAGLKLLSIPVLRTEPQGGLVSCKTCIHTGSEGMQARQSNDPLSLQRMNAVTNPNADVAIAAICCQTSATATGNPISATATHFASGMPPADHSARPLMSFRTIAAGVVLVWAVGALLMLACLARNCGRVLLLRRKSRLARSRRLKAMSQEIATALGMRRVPLLLASNRTIVPLAAGFGKPAIILPRRLLGAINEDQLRDVLVHETAHLKRGDQWTILLQDLAGALYWPIVSVHALNRELLRRAKRSATTLCSPVATRSATGKPCCTSPSGCSAPAR